MLFVDRRWVSRSGRERELGFVRSIDGGRVLGRVRSVSVIQAIRSRTHRTDPASAFITSGWESVEDVPRIERQQTWIFKR